MSWIKTIYIRKKDGKSVEIITKEMLGEKPEEADKWTDEVWE